LEFVVTQHRDAQAVEIRGAVDYSFCRVRGRDGVRDAGQAGGSYKT
jgi:hypothetical protein